MWWSWQRTNFWYLSLYWMDSCFTCKALQHLDWCLSYLQLLLGMQDFLLSKLFVALMVNELNNKERAATTPRSVVWVCWVTGVSNTIHTYLIDHSPWGFSGPFRGQGNNQRNNRNQQHLLRTVPTIVIAHTFCASLRYSDFLSPMLTNTGIFLRDLKVDLSKYSWYPKRKLGVTMHFWDIIKLQFEKERHTLLCILKLFTNIMHELFLKMRGYPQFSFWISITLVKIYISCIITHRGKNIFN